MYAAVRVPLNYWNFSPDSLMVEDLTCQVYSAPKKSPGPSRCSHPGCTEKAKLFYSQVAGGECQVIYFSSSPYTPPPCHPPPTVQWGAETICELVVSVGSEKQRDCWTWDLLRCSPTWITPGPCGFMIQHFQGEGKADFHQSFHMEFCDCSLCYTFITGSVSAEGPWMES